MLKEPCISVDSISKALYNVCHGIELDDPLVLVGNNINIPQNRCQPLEQLKSYIYYLQKISEKYNNSAGCVAYG